MADDGERTAGRRARPGTGATPTTTATEGSAAASAGATAASSEGATAAASTGGTAAASAGATAASSEGGTADGTSAARHPSPGTTAVDRDPGAALGARRAAAFFDLDKTVVAKSSTLAFGRDLYREGLITPAVVLKGMYAQLSYQLFGANDARMEKSRVALLELTKGWEADRVRRLVREALQEVIDPLVYQEALDLFEEHRRAGRDLYLVSSSGEEVVLPVAEYLGVPYVIATRAGIDTKGYYDGTLDFYCYGAGKVDGIREEAERRGIDLTASYAYSDSITDLPMLEAVGHPHAVNPDKELRVVARERDWPILDFKRPVALRRRLTAVPKPPPEVLAGAGALGAMAVAGWVFYQRRQQLPAAS